MQLKNCMKQIKPGDVSACRNAKSGLDADGPPAVPSQCCLKLCLFQCSQLSMIGSGPVLVQPSYMCRLYRTGK